MPTPFAGPRASAARRDTNEPIAIPRATMRLPGPAAPTEVWPMKWTTPVVLTFSLAMSAASLAWSVRRGGTAPGPARERPVATRTGADASRPSSPPAEELRLDRVPGQVEALPQNVYHAVPYNGWPLFEIGVREGQRLKFRRAGGRWEGDSDGLTIQFETPAEIESRKEDVEIARLEERAAELDEDLLEDQLQKDLEAALARETNARQEWDRLERLRPRTAAGDQESQRARGLFELARVQREQAAAVRQKRLARARLKTRAAEHRLRRAEGEYQLADFRRALSWGNVPHRGRRFEEVVVTRVSAAIGDVPGGAGRREPWVEVIDDRVLQVRVFLPVGALDRVVAGRPAHVLQEARNYPGTVAAVGIVADPTTHRVPVLVTVENHDRALKINTIVTVDLVD